MEKQNPRQPKQYNIIFQYNKGTFRDKSIANIKLYYRAAVMQTACYWHKNRQFYQWNQIKDQDINLHTFEHQIFGKEAKVTQ